MTATDFDAADRFAFGKNPPAGRTEYGNQFRNLARAYLELREQTRWRPIEQKRAGEAILYYPAKPDQDGRNALREWITIGHGGHHRKPTHFMPLPSLLKEKSRDHEQLLPTLSRLPNFGWLSA